MGRSSDPVLFYLLIFFAQRSSLPQSYEICVSRSCSCAAFHTHPLAINHFKLSPHRDNERGVRSIFVLADFDALLGGEVGGVEFGKLPFGACEDPIR